MSDTNTTYDVDQQVGTITFERPPVNAFQYADFEAFTELLQSLPREDERVITIQTGGDRTFSAGHDVSEFSDFDQEELEYRDEVYMSFLRTLYELPLPTVVGVDGPAAGAATILSALCDVRVASPDASFSISEINVGIIGGYGPLRRLLPDGVARYMLYTGEALPAERAHELGMVAALDDDARTGATELAREIADHSPDALRAARASAIESQPSWPLEEYRREREHNTELRGLANTQEASSAFLEDRSPSFDPPQYDPHD